MKKCKYCHAKLTAEEIIEYNDYCWLCSLDLDFYNNYVCEECGMVVEKVGEQKERR